MIKWILFCCCCLIGPSIYAQFSFGIVAADTITGEVGVAGGSCTQDNSPEGEAYKASDLIPGTAAMLTQGFYHERNQENFTIQIGGGRGAESTMTWLVSHDAEGSHEFRQYAVALFRNEKLELAALSGTKLLPVQAERFGPNFVIVGNALLSESIIDKMEDGFINTNGDLADKLLGAIRGAKEIGADARCLDSLVSSKSTFIRVAKPTDNVDMLWLDINVSSTPHQIDAIDSLLNRFEAWRSSLTSIRPALSNIAWSVFPNPTTGKIQIHWSEQLPPERMRLYNSLGALVLDRTFNNSIDLDDYKTGQMVFLSLMDSKGNWTPVSKIILRK